MSHGFGAIGYIAALLTTFSSIPQIIRVYRLKESRDISLWTVSSLSAGVLLWVIYGIEIGDLPVIIANAVSLCLSIILICLVVKYR
jgi:MtN3 and saliva related transmembrane protein